MTKTLTLKYECLVALYLYWADATEAVIDVDASNNCQVYFRALAAEEQAATPRSDACFCQVTCEAAVPDHVFAALHEYSESKGVRWDKLPVELREFATKWSQQLSEYVRFAVRTIRWRFKLLAPHNPFIAARGSTWSLDGANWLPFPAEIRAHLLGAPTIPLIPEVVREVEELVRRNDQEPVARELLREARDHQFSSPRSAIIVGVAAAEVGTKGYIAGLVPQAAWIMDEVPSPPVVKMLTRYLPTLTPRLSVVDNPVKILRRIYKVIDGAVNLRNDLVHRNANPPSVGRVVEVLDAVEDLLWILDYHSRHEWAKAHISYDTRVELGLSEPSTP